MKRIMAVYRITHQGNHNPGNYAGTKSIQYKIRSDIEARLFAKLLMEKHGWKYVTIDRKYKDTYRAVAKYTNPKFYVCFHQSGGVFVASYDKAKDFGKDFEGAIAYARNMNKQLNIHY